MNNHIEAAVRFPAMRELNSQSSEEGAISVHELVHRKMQALMDSGEAPVDPRGYFGWARLRKEDPEKLNEVIVQLATIVNDNDVHLTDSGLKEGNLAFLPRICSWYPGGIKELRKKLGVFPRDASGRIKWKELSRDPEKLVRVVEAEVKAVCGAEGKVSSSILEELGRYDLQQAIPSYYPGNWPQLRKNLGMLTIRRDNYWNSETIEKEALQFASQHGDISWDNLQKYKNSALAVAIKNHYPGRIAALRERLGLGKPMREKGTWNQETIESEALAFEKEYGKLTNDELVKHERHDLIRAVYSHYPGGFRRLKLNIGLTPLRKPNDYWRDPVNIEAEANECLTNDIKLDSKSLRAAGKSSLASAIIRFYPGRCKTLREKLGLEAELGRERGFWSDRKNIDNEVAKAIELGSNLSQSSLKELRMFSLSFVLSTEGLLDTYRQMYGIKINRKPDGYWTLENIEMEAEIFYKEHGSISQDLMNTNNRKDLAGAIQNRYPGKLTVLKEKLGVTDKVFEGVNPENANEQLEKLLEAK